MSGQENPAPDQRPIPAVPGANRGRRRESVTRDTPTRAPARPLPYVIAGILLAAAIVFPLLPQMYSFDAPRLGGMPFFYWYQLLWVPISAILSGFAYWLVTTEDRRRRREARSAAAGLEGGERP